MLSSLVDLARESDSGKRRELLGHLSSLFVIGAERYTDEELTLFNGVMKRLADLADEPTRERLSADLSQIGQTSHELVKKLADDSIAIAQYMLQYSQVLTREDLLHFAKVKGQDHLLAISKRDRLEKRLTDVLLERGEQPVRRSVAANPGAELSDWGTRFLVKLAEKDPMLRETMMTRSDLTPQHFDKLIDQLPEEQSAKLRMLYATNEKLVEEMFHEAGQMVANSKLDRKRSRLDTKVSLKEIRDGRKNVNTVFTEYTLSSNLLDLSFLLASLAEIDQKYVVNVILRMEIDGIAILCKALEIGDNEFNTFCKARCSLLKLPTKIAEKWCSDYNVMNTADAQRALRFIKVRLKTMESQAA
jgi:uncharacterized protein (DUF2336 family)